MSQAPDSQHEEPFTRPATASFNARSCLAVVAISVGAYLLVNHLFGGSKLFTLFGTTVITGLGFAFIRWLQSQGHLAYAGERYFSERKRAKLGQGLSTTELARRLGATESDLLSVAAAIEYFDQYIPKRTGGKRLLHIPSPQLKTTQRRMLRRLLGHLQTHPCATGFEPGLSIAHNAAMHAGQAVVIKMDVQNFFPSTSRDRVETYFQRIGWDRPTAELLTNLTTFDGGLPQGAPTSPRLSNLVNGVLDAQIQRFVEKRRGVYTRFADDITISFPKDYPRKVRGTVQHVRRVLKAHGYEPNHKKTRILRQHQQQRVTGLIVNNTVNTPRILRRRLRAIEHRLAQGKRASMTPKQLAGHRAFEQMVRIHSDAIHQASEHH